MEILTEILLNLQNYQFRLFWAELLFMIFLPRRRLYPVRLLVWLPYLILPFFFGHGFDDDFFVIGGYSWSFLAWYAYSIFAVAFCHKAKVGNLVYAVVSAYALQNMFANFRFFLLYAVFIEETIIYAVVCLLMMLLMYALMLVFFVFPWVNKVRLGLQINRLTLLVFAVLVLGVLNVLSSFLINLAPDSLSVQCLLFGICSLVIILLLYTVYDRSYIQYERETMGRMLFEQDRQRKLSEQTIELINMKYHDLKHQLSALKEGAALPDDFYEKTLDSMAIYDSYFKTGNKSLDLVLTEKNLSCKQYKINFSCIADGAALDFMSASDIYSFFGNAIDNAIEYLKGCEEDKRNISLNISQPRQGFVNISIENYCDSALEFSDGLPVTTKANEEGFHGFGTRSMRYIIEQLYGGNLVMRREGNVFIVAAGIPARNREGD